MKKIIEEKKDKERIIVQRERIDKLQNEAFQLVLDKEPEYSDFKTIDPLLRADIVESFGDKLTPKTLQIYTLFYLF